MLSIPENLKVKTRQKTLFLLSYLPTRHFADMGGGKKEREEKDFSSSFLHLGPDFGSLNQAREKRGEDEERSESDF